MLDINGTSPNLVGIDSMISSKEDQLIAKAVTLWHQVERGLVDLAAQAADDGKEISRK